MKTRKNTSENSKRKKMLVRPKKGPHFILVEESGTNTLDKFGKKSEKYSQKNWFHKTNENLHNLNEIN